MKKSQLKRTGIGFMKPKDLKKPFGFCCDANYQDPDTQYDMRIPPFVTSLTNVAPNKDGPDLKFRIQDIGRPAYPILRSGTHKVKKSSHVGRCKRCRGPLRWYVEEEIALAREIIAREKEMKYNRDKKEAQALLRKQKRLKGKKRDRKRVSMGMVDKSKEEEEEADNDDSDRDEEKK